MTKTEEPQTDPSRLDYAELQNQIWMNQRPVLTIPTYPEFDKWMSEETNPDIQLRMPNTEVAIQAAANMYEIERQQLTQNNDDYIRTASPFESPEARQPEVFGLLSGAIQEAERQNRFK